MQVNKPLTAHLVMLSHLQDGVIKLFANKEQGYYRLYCNTDARPYHIADISEAINNIQDNVTVYIINPDSIPFSGY